MRLVSAFLLVAAVTFSGTAAHAATPVSRLQVVAPKAVADPRFAVTPSPTPGVNVSVAEIAKLVTVRIISEPGAGSGVIIGRSGQTYTVLTNDHVVDDSRDHRYTVLTADGVQHPAVRQREAKFGDIDLALVQFTSDKTYRVAAIGNSASLSVGSPVYAAGFPNWYFDNNGNTVESTRDWGLRAFRLTSGEVEMLPAVSLHRGYQLGYTNRVETGMSGGPVLNQDGEVIGINGRLQYPLQGIRVFTFADGTVPSATQFRQMEALSWAIPIATFQHLSASIKLNARL